MDTNIAAVAGFLLVCEAASCIQTAYLCPPRWTGGRQILLFTAVLAGSAALAFVWPYSRMGTIAAAAAWAGLSGFLLCRRWAAPASLLGWGLCLAAAALTTVLADLPGRPLSAPRMAFIVLTWTALSGLLLGAAHIVIQKLRHREVDWTRILIFFSACLETAAIGLFTCHMLGTPGITASLMAALLLGISYIVLLFMYRHVLREDARWQRRRQVVQAELSAQKEQFAATAAVLTHAQRMRHDFGNHAEVARSLAEAGQTERALQYLGKVRSAWLQGNAGSVEPHDFGQLTGDLAAACAARGITLQVSGSVPDEAGFGTHKVLMMLKDITDWCIDQLNGAESSTLSLSLQAEGCFECQLSPSALPSAAAQQRLLDICGAAYQVEYESQGQYLRFCISRAPG